MKINNIKLAANFEYFTRLIKQSFIVLQKWKCLIYFVLQQFWLFLSTVAKKIVCVCFFLGGDSDSEAENEKLLELEEIIRSHEPLETDDTNAPAESHQLHIGIERYRAPELIFKPYMQGCPEAGLNEIIAYVLSLFSNDEQTRLASNVVLTGGLANLPGMQERIQANLVAVRPFQSYSRVVVMEEPSLGAWEGMRRFCEAGEEFKRAGFTRSDYEEKGGDYFRMHRMSNLYCPAPKGQAVEVDT